MILQTQKRRLTTILAADVVGFSRMMAADEEGTVRTLKSYRQIIDSLIARHDGRIFNTAGDAVLAEFASAVETVRCAISIQDELRARNDQRPPEQKLIFRIGVNVGDVLEDGDDLLGDGVNVAARLEGLAQPGSVCISESTFAQVKDKLSVAFSDLGAHHVKNIPQPVSAYGIVPGRVEVFEDSDPISLALPAARPTPELTIGRRKWLLPITVITIAVALSAVVFGSDIRAVFEKAGSGRSTTDMSASKIQTMISGLRINGARRRDGQTFSIVLRTGGDARFTLESDNGDASVRVENIGRWWAEDRRFCMAVPQLNRGRRVCPRIVEESGRLRAYDKSGAPLNWRIER